MKLYRTIVADPPWDYGNKKWVSFTHGGKGPKLEKPMPYTAMSLKDIKALPISALADTDARLFLWTTNRYLCPAFDVISAWGFAYTQSIVWRKTGNPSPFTGTGVAPVHHEFLLIAKRGAPEILGQFPTSVVDAPAAVFGHSAKPECFLDHIEAVSPEPRLELFARRARMAGWDYWGDESHGTAQMGAA